MTITCPGCAARREMPHDLLGENVRCLACGVEFVPEVVQRQAGAGADNARSLAKMLFALGLTAMLFCGAMVVQQRIHRHNEVVDNEPYFNIAIILLGIVIVGMQYAAALLARRPGRSWICIASSLALIFGLLGIAWAVDRFEEVRSRAWVQFEFLGAFERWDPGENPKVVPVTGLQAFTTFVLPFLASVSLLLAAVVGFSGVPYCGDTPSATPNDSPVDSVRVRQLALRLRVIGVVGLLATAVYAWVLCAAQPPAWEWWSIESATERLFYVSAVAAVFLYMQWAAFFLARRRDPLLVAVHSWAAFFSGFGLTLAAFYHFYLYTNDAPPAGRGSPEHLLLEGLALSLLAGAMLSGAFCGALGLNCFPQKPAASLEPWRQRLPEHDEPWPPKAAR